MKSEKLLSVKWWDANLESFGEFNVLGAIQKSYTD